MVDEIFHFLTNEKWDYCRQIEVVGKENVMWTPPQPVAFDDWLCIKTKITSVRFLFASNVEISTGR